MEGRKQMGSSSSSFASDIFGAKNSASSSSSSTGTFGSVFSPASTVVGRNSSRSDVLDSLINKDSRNQAWSTKHGVPDNVSQSREGENRSVPDKNRSSIFQDETVQPCFLSSSIYYGGQDIYSHSPSTQASGSHPTFMKDGREDDTNENNLNSASRGNWWQGSLYY